MDTTPNPAIPLSDYAYDTLRNLIVRVEIAPGSTLSEEDLSATMKVGLTPVRNAIKRLAFERLVAIYPRRGTFAAEINIGDELWLTEIRQELEGLTAQLAAERATSKECSALLDIAKAIQSAESIMEVTDLDASFHRQIFRMARNPFLEPTAHLYFNLSLRIWYYCKRNFTISDSPGDDHLAIAEAIGQRDAKGARQALRDHVANASAAIRTMLSSRL